MPSGSPISDIQLPDGDIWSTIFERKDRPFPDDKVMLVDSQTGRSYTFAQTREAAVDFGKGLKTVWEWKRKEVLAIFSPNCIDTPSIMWGCHWAGGIVTTANPGYTADELAFQLKDAGAKAIITQKALLPVAKAAAQAAGISEEMIGLLGDERDPDARFKHFTSIRNISGTTRYRRTKAKPDDVAFLPYSSGTTGRPKGVMLSHRNISSNTLMIAAYESRWMSWERDSMLAFLPFFHIYGLTVSIHQAFWSGYKLVVMAKYDIEGFCKSVQDHKITMAFVVPPVVLQLAKHPAVSKYDISSLRMMNSGAAPLTRELVEACYERTKVPVKQGYGLTETSPTTHVQGWDDWKTHIGSVGVLLPNQEAKYMSEDGKELSAGQVGELWIRGPNIFLGYLNNPEGTANALTSDGYFKTGDVGYQDDKGNFYITDRVKELIKYKGFQVPPAELEGLLQGHPKVDDVAVVGVYDKEQATEVPRAYIVVTPKEKESDAVKKDITDWLAGKVANHKRLRGGIRFVKEIPKSASGKILRRVLRDQVAKEEKENPKAKL